MFNTRIGQANSERLREASSAPDVVRTANSRYVGTVT